MSLLEYTAMLSRFCNMFWVRILCCAAAMSVLLISSVWIWHQRGSVILTAGKDELYQVSHHFERSTTTRKKRYTINPMGAKWNHSNLTYKIIQFPNTLNKEDTEKALAIAFRMWSKVSSLTFQRVQPNQASDLSIGFYSFNHSDCWSSPLHPCFDGLNGELAHAFLPPRGEIHFDNHEFWVLGPSRFSWRQGCSAKDGSCETTEVLKACGSEGQCHHKCDGCKDSLPRNSTGHIVKVKTLYVPKGQSVTFNCSENKTQPRKRISWFKDRRRILSSSHGLISLFPQFLVLQADKVTQGRYTCVIRQGRVTLGGRSWNLHVT
ncbi:matrix metalloproteinase-23 isoform X2 [Bombina bombina]|uniref:matrix metalloproteinase-23 isoform X2 n=1 Tax=Bombina bombina TaxID=8345 RepID=UPI00235ACA2C|nr:matrix metalloproteinase-23 isoform X2 [Bombina bombina]